jgi:hypothetical protein
MTTGTLTGGVELDDWGSTHYSERKRAHQTNDRDEGLTAEEIARRLRLWLPPKQ